MYQPSVEKYKTTFMQRIQQAASRGYEWYLTGEVKADKVARFADKMNELYLVGANENQRSYRKRMGRANAFLRLYPIPDSDCFFWCLMATNGTGDIHEKEALISTRSKNRLTIFDGYELVFLPREGRGVTVTWRMNRKLYESWCDRIRKAIRNSYSDDLARQCAFSLSRCPGFSGVRDQCKKLRLLFNAEWKRNRSKSSEPPPVLAIGYTRVIKKNEYDLDLVVRRLKQGKSAFPNASSAKE